MSMMDPVADMLTRVRNAVSAGHEKVEIPASRLKANIVRVLKEEGFIKNFRLVRDESGHAHIRVYLRNSTTDVSPIRGLKRISRPGRRVYVGHQELNRRGSSASAVVVFVSTPKGVLTAEKARQFKVGGELLCEVW